MISYTQTRMENKISDGGIFTWVRHLDAIFLFLFIFGTNFLHGYSQARMLGLAMIGFFFLIHLPWFSFVLQRIIPPPPELLCFTTWVVWAVFTGYVVAIDRDSFWDSSKVTLQILVMVWTIYAILRTRQTMDVVLLAIIAGGLLQIAAVFLGQADILAAVEFERQRGLTTNANSLGGRMIWCVLSALMFWKVQGRWSVWIRAGILGLTVVACFVVLGTGSRKSLISLLFFLFCWAVSASSSIEGMRAYIFRFFIVAILLGIMAYMMPLVIDNTIVGKRFDQFFNKGQGSIISAIEANDRYDMYLGAFEIFLKHPLFGVGLDNFKAHYFRYTYSHSDYMESLTNTGLIGFLLYQSYYIFLLFRTMGLLRRINDPKNTYQLKMILISVFTIMVIGLGAPHYNSQFVFALMTTFSVYTWELQRSNI